MCGRKGQASVNSMNDANSNDWSEDMVIRCGIVDETRREGTKLTKGKMHIAKIQHGDEPKESGLH